MHVVSLSPPNSQINTHDRIWHTRGICLCWHLSSSLPMIFFSGLFWALNVGWEFRMCKQAGHFLQAFSWRFGYTLLEPLIHLKVLSVFLMQHREICQDFCSHERESYIEHETWVSSWAMSRHAGCLMFDGTLQHTSFHFLGGWQPILNLDSLICFWATLAQRTKL